uniref:HMG box domain-containing protein n=1 Tax=Odontella aurita TaxID=265563 RepID=A0A7S4MVX3_9STRA|mmetsp:Transcript_35800/g.106847  ORF Transcript_35800/g.106847 Transcript_35800/m.106847 type:complete len:489 (+) Transcript_35800:62-1528(+)
MNIPSFFGSDSLTNRGINLNDESPKNIAISSTEMRICRKRPSPSNLSVPSKKKWSASKKRRPNGKPTRPLSAYNIFFRSERERMLASMNQGDKEGPQRNKFSFEGLAKNIASKWHALDSEDRRVYEAEVDADRERYRSQMDTWLESEEGKEHKLQMKKEKMARAGSKDKDFASILLPMVGDSPCGDVIDTNNKFDDDDLTPLQRMFRRVDAIVKQTEGKETSETNSQDSQCSVPIEGHHIIPTSVVEKEITLSRPAHTVQNMCNIQDAHITLEKHSKRCALSFDAGILPPRSCMGFNNRETPSIIMAKQCTTSFQLPSIPSTIGSVSINGSATKTNAMASVPSQTSIETIDSLSNLLGSFQSIHSFLSAKNCLGKRKSSAESFDRSFSPNEEATMSGDNYYPIKPAPGKKNLYQEARGEHVSLPTAVNCFFPVTFPELSPARTEKHTRLSLNHSGTKHAPSLSRINALWPVLAETERFSTPTPHPGYL